MSSFETCTLAPVDYASGIATQQDQLREEIIQDVALSSPYLSIVDGGTVENNEGKNIRTLVQNRVSPSYSLTDPSNNAFDSHFQDDTLVCGLNGGEDKIGQTEFTTQLESLRGKGPLVCLKGTRIEVKNSYIAASASLKNSIEHLMSSDIRAELLKRSGVKFVAKENTAFDSLIAGGRNTVSASWSTLMTTAINLPDAPMSFKALIRLGQYMREELRVPHFGSGGDLHYIVITSVQQNERFRNESEFRDTILAKTQGGFAEGVDSIKAYKFVDMVQRGFKFGTDQEPLRFDDVDGSGNPVLIEPIISQTSDHGDDAVTNPAWTAAQFEIGFIVAKDSFRRIVPTSFVGEGDWKFMPQAHMGELKWVHREDNDCNLFGDFGRHIYQITRAIEAVQPHAVIPFAYKRCDDDLGLAAC